eukprot:4584156-Heterocapsa_arctica.AAC.1
MVWWQLLWWFFVGWAIGTVKIKANNKEAEVGQAWVHQVENPLVRSEVSRTALGRGAVPPGIAVWDTGRMRERGREGEQGVGS